MELVSVPLPLVSVQKATEQGESGRTARNDHHGQNLIFIVFLHNRSYLTIRSYTSPLYNLAQKSFVFASVLIFIPSNHNPRAMRCSTPPHTKQHQNPRPERCDADPQTRTSVRFRIQISPFLDVLLPLKIDLPVHRRNPIN